VLFVCCLIVVPLPPGENPFAVNNNNNNKSLETAVTFENYGYREIKGLMRTVVGCGAM
jgi:hypothetical protein